MVMGDRCLDLDGATYCGRDCSDGNLHGTPAGECPDGYECLPVDGVPNARQCAPLSGSCTCLDEHDGESRTCVRANGIGTCYGDESCDANAGWSGCSAREPRTEICNGVDDDCNGSIDDGSIAGVGDQCVQRTVNADCGSKCSIHSGPVDDIEGGDVGRPLKQRAGLFEGLFAAAEKAEAGSRAIESLGDGAAYTATGSGDQNAAFIHALPGMFFAVIVS